jgi:formate hydrogenlyase transcriptional activator
VLRQSLSGGPLSILGRFRAREEDEGEQQFEPIVGCSRAFKFILSEVEHVAPTDATVLILGETGTGKEMIARAIHQLSPRSAYPFVKLNCAAIPFGFLESELFGHEKGVFAGAVARKVGRFERADRGTFFLDEIGDLPLALQPKFLRILQGQEFERPGSNRTRKVDVRLIAATHRNLGKMVGRDEFRSDLFYRLNVFPLTIPPLRQRREDIRELVLHFVEEFGRRLGKRIEHISETTMNAFITYPWPANVRELQNLVERAVICSQDGVLANPLSSLPTSRLRRHGRQSSLREHEATLIRQTLETTGGKIGGQRGAAALLGVKRTTLLSKMKRLGIRRAQHRRFATEVSSEVCLNRPRLTNSGREVEAQEMVPTRLLGLPHPRS